MGRVNQIPSAAKFKNVTPLGTEKGKFLISKEDHDRITYINQSVSKIGRTDDWFPSMNQAMELALDPVSNYQFIQWILYSNQELAAENQEVTEYLKGVLKDNFVVKDVCG